MFLLALLLSAFTAFAHPDHEDAIGATEDQARIFAPLSSPTGSCPAPTQKEQDEVWGLLGSSYPGRAAFWKNSSCSVLFSETPPVSFLKLDPSRKYLKRDNWFPVCSLTNLREIAQRDPGQSLENVFSTNKAGFEWLDNCAKELSFTPGTKDFKNPTQIQEGVDDKASEEKIKEWKSNYQAIFEKARDAIAKDCCPDQRCKDLLSTIEMRWCKLQTELTLPEPCAGVKAFYHWEPEAAADWESFFTKYKSAKAGKGNVPVSIGFFQISGLFRPGGTIAGAENAITHELGHACSFIRRQLEMDDGDQVAYADYSGGTYWSASRSQKSDPCKLTAAARATYRKLYSKTKFGVDPMSMDSIDCLLGLAENGGQKRFVPGKCEGGCPRRYLEETFANWMETVASYTHTTNTTLLNQLCFGYVRDYQHPLKTDVLKCTLKDRGYREWMMESIQCKK